MKSEKITITNYEFFAIDYLENNLNEDIKISFEQFLENNIEIKNEIITLQNIRISPGKNIIYKDKIKLKKSPVENLEYTDYLLISSIEKNISEEQKHEIKNIIKNNQTLKKELSLYKKTFLPPTTIHFPEKEKLKKSFILNITETQNLITTIAAILIIFFGIKIFISNQKKEENNLHVEIAKQIIEHKNNRNPYVKNIKNDVNIQQKNTYVYNNKTTNKQQTNSENIEQITVNNEKQNSNDKIFNTPNNFEEKKINLKLVTMTHRIPEYAVIQQHTEKIKLKDKINITPEKVLNFVFEQMSIATENNKKVEVKIDKNSDCYGIKLDEKAYYICLK